MTTNSRMTSTIRRGKINGKQTGGPPLSEAEHFWKCGWFDMRDLGQMLAHVHDAEIEICGGPGPPKPVALDLKAKPTANHPPIYGCYHVAKTRTGL